MGVETTIVGNANNVFSRQMTGSKCSSDFAVGVANDCSGLNFSQTQKLYEKDLYSSTKGLRYGGPADVAR